MSAPRSMRAKVGRCAPCAGQSAFEVLVITAVLVAGFWGIGWLHGDGGVVALLVDGLRAWHQRLAAGLAVPG